MTSEFELVESDSEILVSSIVRRMDRKPLKEKVKQLYNKVTRMLDTGSTRNVVIDKKSQLPVDNSPTEI